MEIFNMYTCAPLRILLNSMSIFVIILTFFRNYLRSADSGVL